MTTLEVLIAARDWLAVGPERWCQGRMYKFLPRSDELSATSAMGAIRQAAKCADEDEWLTRALSAECALARSLLIRSAQLRAWEDCLPVGRAGWEQVVRAFGLAIAAERSK